jgi:hypothetical protein
LSRVAQAPLKEFLAGFQPPRLDRALLVCVSLLVSGCTSGGLEPGEVDRTLLTSDIQPASGEQADPGRLSDESTIRNAVSSADIASLAGASLPWANAETGARGIISGLAESRQNDLLCRRFTTTRESFDGVRLFEGEACMLSAGAWRLQSFRAL